MAFHTTTTSPTSSTTTGNSMSAISQLLLAQFWPNFKGRFLGPSWTDFNCYGKICRGNICPGDICSYQEYLSWYWHDFNQSLKVGSWDHLKHIPTLTKKQMFCQKKNFNKKFSGQKQIFAKQNFAKNFLPKKFCQKFFAKTIFNQKKICKKRISPKKIFC